MTIALIAFVLFLGIVLIFLEIFVIPGTTIFGIGGVLLSAAAIFFSYKSLGLNAGNITVVLGFTFFMILFYFGRKLMEKNKMSLQEELTSKVNMLEADVKVGDIGSCFSDLKPNGKAIFNDEKIEVFSTGEYITASTQIQIVQIENSKIIVKPLN
jgi:membrane-bound ClpP family serine protease